MWYVCKMRPSPVFRFPLNLKLFLLLPLLAFTVSAESEPEVVKPGKEEAIVLFNGKDLSGWDGDKKWWSVEEGVIVGRNNEAVPSSTYLFSTKSYRNFRLLLEVKQTMSPRHSTMHSAVAALGERFDDKGASENSTAWRLP